MGNARACINTNHHGKKYQERNDENARIELKWQWKLGALGKPLAHPLQVRMHLELKLSCSFPQTGACNSDIGISS